MDRKQMKNLIELLRISLIFIALYFVFRESLNIYALIAALVIPNMLAQILLLLLPKDKKRKSKASQKKKVKNISNNPTNKVPTTRLLPDSEILKMSLEQMSGLEFERLCFLYYKAKGYKPKETPKGADGGVDLLIYQRYHNDYEAVQVKHYINSGNNITVREIRELNSSKQNHGCVLARFITTSTYSKEAMLQADKWRIKTHDIEWVRNKIDTWRKEEAKKPKYA